MSKDKAPTWVSVWHVEYASAEDSPWVVACRSYEAAVRHTAHLAQAFPKCSCIRITGPHQHQVRAGRK